ncbi:MAG TPA: hypothetical protein VJK04_00095 [Candidatus Paceibacterota bacterium]
MDNLEARVKRIEERNAKVEIDKAWETSWTRKLLLVTFTYLVIGTYLKTIGVEWPWINAIVPAVGFLISTLAVPWLKKVWTKFYYKD